VKPRGPAAGATTALLALAGLWLVTRRAEVRLEDGVNRDLARSAAAFLAVVTPSDGGRGYLPSRLLSGVGALAISSFWSGGLQGALGRTPLLPDTIGLTPLPEPVAERLDQGGQPVIATHARARVALAPLFDRDHAEVLGWIGVWGGLPRPDPGFLNMGVLALAVLAVLAAGLRCHAGVPGRRRTAALVGAGLGLVVTAAALAGHLRALAARATETRLITMRRLIEVAATADGVRRARLPEIAVDARVGETTLDPVARPRVDRVTIGGVTYARTFAATPRSGDQSGLELAVLPSEATLGPTWGAMIALVLVGATGLAFAAWSSRTAANPPASRPVLAAFALLVPALAQSGPSPFPPAASRVSLACHWPSRPWRPPRCWDPETPLPDGSWRPSARRPERLRSGRPCPTGSIHGVYY
jgi:hypothetical protein